MEEAVRQIATSLDNLSTELAEEKRKYARLNMKYQGALHSLRKARDELVDAELLVHRYKTSWVTLDEYQKITVQLEASQDKHNLLRDEYNNFVNSSEIRYQNSCKEYNEKIQALELAKPQRCQQERTRKSRPRDRPKINSKLQQMYDELKLKNVSIFNERDSLLSEVNILKRSLEEREDKPSCMQLESNSAEIQIKELDKEIECLKQRCELESSRALHEQADELLNEECNVNEDALEIREKNGNQLSPVSSDLDEDLYNEAKRESRSIRILSPFPPSPEPKRCGNIAQHNEDLSEVISCDGSLQTQNYYAFSSAAPVNRPVHTQTDKLKKNLTTSTQTRLSNAIHQSPQNTSMDGNKQSKPLPPNVSDYKTGIMNDMCGYASLGSSTPKSIKSCNKRKRKRSWNSNTSHLIETVVEIHATPKSFKSAFKSTTVNTKIQKISPENGKKNIDVDNCDFIVPLCSEVSDIKPSNFRAYKQKVLELFGSDSELDKSFESEIDLSQDPEVKSKEELSKSSISVVSACSRLDDHQLENKNINGIQALNQDLSECSGGNDGNQLIANITKKDLTSVKEHIKPRAIENSTTDDLKREEKGLSTVNQPNFLNQNSTNIKSPGSSSRCSEGNVADSNRRYCKNQSSNTLQILTTEANKKQVLVNCDRISEGQLETDSKKQHSCKKGSVPFQSPASPEPPKIEDEPVVPKIIPLERICGSAEVLSEDTQPDLKRAVPNATGHAKMLLHQMLQFDEDESIKAAVRSLVGHTPEFIAKLVLEQAMSDQREELATRKGTSEPLLTVAQKALLKLMVGLDNLGHGQVCHTFLNKVDALLPKPINPAHLCRITRLYVAICKRSLDMWRIRKALCFSFAFMGDLSIPFMYFILQSWLEVIPMRDSALHESLFVKAIVQMVLLKRCMKPGYQYTNLCNLLKCYYKYSLEPLNSKDLLLEMFREYIVEGNECLLVLSLALSKELSKEWVFKQIDAEIKPQVNPRKDIKQVCAIVKLVGRMTRYHSETLDLSVIESNCQWLEMCCETPYTGCVRDCAISALEGL